MEPGIRTRLTNLLTMVAAPEKYDKNVKLKFPLEFYLKKVLEYVKNIKVTAPAIIEALENSDVEDFTQIQEILETYVGQFHVGIAPILLEAIGTYANECANTIITTQQDNAFYTIGGSEYEAVISSLYYSCINALVHSTTPYITQSDQPYTFIPINSCYNNTLCASFDVVVSAPNFGSYVIHFSMFIQPTYITICATKLGVNPD